MNYGFDKSQRSTFSYWFAHWCAFQMVALNLHIWKPKYLLHDIEKPWLRLFWTYKEVQHWHRTHNNHHIEWLESHLDKEFDIDAMIIDNECSRFTKRESQLTAREFMYQELKEFQNQRSSNVDPYYKKAIDIYSSGLWRARQLGLK